MSTFESYYLRLLLFGLPVAIAALVVHAHANARYRNRQRQLRANKRALSVGESYVSQAQRAVAAVRN